MGNFRFRKMLGFRAPFEVFFDKAVRRTKSLLIVVVVALLTRVRQGVNRRMSSSISEENAEKILSSVNVPPRPTIIGELIRERNQPNPDMRKIAQLISKDIALSVAMLKAVNSPFFGLRNKIDSPQQAVLTLGLNNVANMVTGLSLKGAMGGKSLRLDRFWDSAERVAKISAYLTGRVPGTSRDLAYTYGLFQDCGIPLLMQKFPDYLDTLKLASAEAERPFTAIEEDLHNTNHATIGYLMAKNWFLPEVIYKAILDHHNLSVLSAGSKESLSADSRALIAIARVAEHISESMRMRDDPSWGKDGPAIMDYLGLSKEEFDDIEEEMFQQQEAFS